MLLNNARRMLPIIVSGTLAACAGTPEKRVDVQWPMVPAVAHARATRPLPAPEPVPVASTATPTEANDTGFSVTSIPPNPYQDVFARVRDGYALPAETDPSIDRMVQFYAGKPQFLNRTFERGERYLHYVAQELEARHMPLELARF